MKDKELKKRAFKEKYGKNKLTYILYYLWIKKVKYIKHFNNYTKKDEYNIKSKLNPFNPLTYIFVCITLIMGIIYHFCTEMIPDIISEFINAFKYN